ncbi:MULTISPECIES: thiolase domain-containing protein [Microbacterium]|uniref:Thiolase domain-containing protein n=1 Tax=Microbacterium profundi TaxID=450380 RepID=A0ABV3LKB5_9MICO|nr:MULTISPECIES: thiolase domain-containing protein [Microbacterium]
MSIRGAAFIAGAYEHPQRVIPDKSLGQVHAEVAAGALRDAGLSFSDVDAYFCAGDAPGLGGISMADYMGLKLRYTDSTETGGSSYIAHIGHAAAAIKAGKASIALISLAGLPRQMMGNLVMDGFGASEDAFEAPFGPTVHGLYALAARRHMYEFGTTSEQLAEIKVAASIHAQHNPNALLSTPVTVEEVVNSPMVSDPLHRLDCCVVTDGGGALIVVSPEVARDLERSVVKVLGHGEAPKHTNGGKVNVTFTGARWSGPTAFAEAGVTPQDIDYASIYDSFTITVLETIEDLGFCEKGKGGEFVLDGTLQAPFGKLPFNTDGGGLANNHPANRGGMTKVLEAVRQLRDEAHPAVQVPNAQLAIAHGTGGSLPTRMGAATVILGREDS